MIIFYVITILYNSYFFQNQFLDNIKKKYFNYKQLKYIN